MRRGLLAVVLVVLAAFAHAQPVNRMVRVAYLGFLGEPRDGSALRDAFLRGLRDLGYVPGRNLAFEVRRYDSAEEMRRAVTELMGHKPEVIFVGPPLAAMTAVRMTKDVPIVCGSCGDPVENGLAASLARPGGRVTGLASLSAELIGKRIGIMTELLPGTSRIAAFVFPNNPGTRATLAALDAAQRTLGVEIQRLEIREPGDIEPAYRAAVAGRASAVVLQDDPLTRSARKQFVEFALKHRLPLSSGLQELADAGALVAYGPDRVQMAQRAAVFVDKIIKGAKPAELPFEQAGTLELIVNLRTAKALGLTIPHAFLVRVNRAIN